MRLKTFVLSLVVVSSSLLGACGLVSQTAAPASTSGSDAPSDRDRGLVLAVESGGWDAVAPWRSAVADAYARANAVLASHEFRRRLTSASHTKWVYQVLVGARLDANSPYRMRFRAAVSGGPAVVADCHGTVWLNFPKVLNLGVDTFAAELSRVAAMQGLRGRRTCDGEILSADTVDAATVDAVASTVKDLASLAFPGGPRTVADAAGWGDRAGKTTMTAKAETQKPKDSDAKRRYSDLAIHTAPELPDTKAAPEVVLSYEPISGGTARLRVNARPWASCSVDRHAPRTTPFSLNVGPGNHEVRCRKGGEHVTKRIFIPKRPFSRLSRGRLIVTTDGADRCYVDGIRYNGSGVSVDVAPGVRRVECVYEGNTVTQGVKVIADRVIPVHLDVRQRRLTAMGYSQVTVNAKPWARCAIDGGSKQTTPFKVWVKPGRHTVSCEKGDAKVTKRIKVKKRRRMTVMLKMSDAELDLLGDDFPAGLTITAFPWATCSIDGKMVGVARIETTVKPGLRRVQCEHKGKTITRKVLLQSGQKRRVHFDFPTKGLP